MSPSTGNGHRIPQLAEQPFVARLARTREDWRSVFRLLHDSRLPRGGGPRLSNACWVSPYHLDVHTRSVLVESANQTVLTLSTVASKDLDVPMAEPFPDVVAELRRRDAKFAQIAFLAHRQTRRHELLSAVMTGLRLAIQELVWRQFHEAWLVISARQAAFFASAVGFRIMTAPQPGLPLVAGSIEFDKLRRHRPAAWDRLFGDAIDPAELVADGMTPDDQEYFWPDVDLQDSPLADSRLD